MIRWGIVGVVALLTSVGIGVGLPHLAAVEYTNDSVTNVEGSVAGTESPEEKKIRHEGEVMHVPLPSQVKAIYMTACVAGTPTFRDKLIALIDETEINAVVIDVKDYSGAISFPPLSPEWTPAWEASKCGTSEMKELVALLHEKGVYTIARITVFQDPLYASMRPDLAVKKSDRTTVWKDGKGLSFIDVAAKEYWDHLIKLSVDTYTIGFDELNFDYVRYPSDGNMQDIAFVHSDQGPHGSNKQANLEAFFKYLSEALSDESRFSHAVHVNTGREKNVPYISADLFGMTTTNTDDLSIGQVQERAAPYFDFIAPMVYPSHYPKNYLNLGDPNDHPYEIVHHAMKEGVRRMTSATTPVEGFLHERIGTTTPAVYKKPVYTADRLRTWIQDFDYGGDYDAADVRTQIQASYDAGVNSWMIWAPSNIYTRGALHASDDHVLTVD